MLNLRVIKDLNTSATQGNIQTLKGKQIEEDTKMSKEEIMAMTNIEELEDLRFFYIKEYQHTKYRSAQRLYMDIADMINARISELTK